MKRRFVNVDIFGSRNMVKDGNVDHRYWFDKTNIERVHAASIMTSVAFREPDFFKKKLDRSVFTIRKHGL